ncbi:MAG: hypothetical protein IMZ62_06610 [Chloroflexi bacterium]|nr:hypothetical protein [Chloroflexota bacterium]
MPETDYSDEDLGALSEVHWKVYHGLSALADQEGRLEDRPKWICSKICPYHPSTDIDKILNDLAQIKDLLEIPRFIERYEVNGYKYIQLLRFTAEQRIHPHEAQSVIPPKDTPTTYQGDTKDARCRSLPSLPSLPSKPSIKKEHTLGSVCCKEGFQRFWDAWPTGYKIGKGKSLESWLKLNPSEELVEKILKAIEKQKKSQRWHDEVIPNPVTWLNQKRWDDDLKPAKAKDRAIPDNDTRAVF